MQLPWEVHGFLSSKSVGTATVTVELVGPVNEEGFGATGKVRIEHLSTGEAVRDVVYNIVGDFDPEFGAVLHLVDFVQSVIHRIFEVF